LVEYQSSNVLPMFAPKDEKVVPQKHAFAMTDLDKDRCYVAAGQLGDGRRVIIRALKPNDESDMLDAVGKMSNASLQRRFFGAKRHFSENEKVFYLNPDFSNHAALVVTIDDGTRIKIIAGGRFVVVQPGCAEIALAVVDEFQGQGVGTILMHHLTLLARESQLSELIAEVLPENVAMLKIFEKSGLAVTTRRHAGVVHVKMRIS
jgi:RimJ/RimL family protein N-acetyltransferase